MSNANNIIFCNVSYLEGELQNAVYSSSENNRDIVKNIAVVINERMNETKCITMNAMQNRGSNS